MLLKVKMGANVQEIALVQVSLMFWTTFKQSPSIQQWIVRLIQFGFTEGNKLASKGLVSRGHPTAGRLELVRFMCCSTPTRHQPLESLRHLLRMQDYGLSEGIRVSAKESFFPIGLLSFDFFLQQKPQYRSSCLVGPSIIEPLNLEAFLDMLPLP